MEAIINRGEPMPGREHEVERLTRLLALTVELKMKARNLHYAVALVPGMNLEAATISDVPLDLDWVCGKLQERLDSLTKQRIAG